MAADKSHDYFLDITKDVCPLTFVKAKLRLEAMASGETLEIRLNAGEPLENVPKSLAECGHRILILTAEELDNPGGVHRLIVRKT